MNHQNTRMTGEELDRWNSVRQSIAIVELEGTPVPDEAKALMFAYARGEISLDELIEKGIPRKYNK